jgi:hypothetical protein
MASRVTPAGNQSVGGPAPSSFANGVAGGWIGYAVKTASQSSISTEVQVLSMNVTCTVNASRKVRISCTGETQVTNTDTTGVLRIKQDGVEIRGFPIGQRQIAGGPGAQGHTFFAVVNPSTGSHTYTVTLARTTGTGTFAESANDGILLVEDVGPA